MGMNRAQRRSEWLARFRRDAGALRSGQTRGFDSNQASEPRDRLRTEVLRSVELRVDELSLRGFDRKAAPRIARAFESEMKNLLKSQGLPNAWKRSTKAGEIQAGTTRLLSHSNARWTGQRIARAVFFTGTGELR